jgi:mono/diheme cytochrome c family protein
MPAMNFFNDEQIAAILTYIRREWDHQADPVSAETVARIRAAVSTRQDAWTEAELLKIP